MRVLEVLNSYPGENFLREHARAILRQGDTELMWAFWQTGQPGVIKNPVEGLKRTVGLVNANRISRFRKVLTRVRHMGRRNAFESEFLRQVKALRPDVVHFQFASLASLHYRQLSRLSVPFTFSV